MIADYADLMMTVSDHTGFDDLPAHFGRICLLAERTIEKDLRHSAMLTDATVLLMDGRGDLPDDFIAPESVNRSLEDRTRALEQFTLEVFRKRRLTGFAIGGAGPRLHVYPHQEEVFLTYYARLPSLEVNDINWLLEEDPEIYLHACAFQAQVWKGAADAAAATKPYLMGLINERNIQDGHQRYSDARVRREGKSP